jgi:hypothetical protein
MSWYLTIRSDAAYRRTADARVVSDYLSALPELVRTGANTFGSAPGQPWIVVTLAMSRDGSYADLGVAVPTINLIDIVCSYDHDEHWYDALASRIAALLGWEALDEHEERLVWAAAPDA